MKEFKGTKGSWKIDKYNSISCNGNQIVSASGIGTTSHEDEEYKANAKLIAASLKLLEACQVAYNICDKMQFPTEFELEALKVDLRKAIEKALK